jgi:transcriptional activator HAC1
METALVNHQLPQLTSPTHQLDHNNIMDSANSPPHYLKMEDLQSGSSPSPTSFDNCGTSTQASPPPIMVTSKPAKKRKSWGQELPEPKTTLPPRKRAKTDDEKEQRRIERIKRNRAAAHNSRERKRQEAENLAVLLAQAEAKLEAYQRLHGPLPADIVLREVQVCNEGYVIEPTHTTRASNRADTPNSDYSTPAPSLAHSRGSIDAAASPASPTDTVISNYPTIKIEPSDLPTTISPPAFETLDPKSGSLPHLDATQHSAAMLCDLQCPSSQRRSRMSTTTPTSSSPSSTSAATSPTTWTTWMASLFTTLLAFQVRTCYQQILLAIWTLSPTRMERMIRASTTRLATLTRSRSTTSLTMMPSLSRSTTPLAQLNAATGVATRDEGAHTALTTRSSSVTDSRAKSGSADGAKNRSSVCAALKRDGDSHGKHQGQDDDGVGH